MGLHRVGGQVEKLIEETKQVTVMEPRVVPETRTIQVTVLWFLYGTPDTLPSSLGIARLVHPFAKMHSTCCEAGVHSASAFFDSKSTEPPPFWSQPQVPMQRMIPQEHTIMVPRVKMVPVGP